MRTDPGKNRCLTRCSDTVSGGAAKPAKDGRDEAIDVLGPEDIIDDAPAAKGRADAGDDAGGSDERDEFEVIFDEVTAQFPLPMLRRGAILLANKYGIDGLDFLTLKLLRKVLAMPDQRRNDARFKVSLEELSKDAEETEDTEYPFADWQRAHHTLAVCERLEAVVWELQRLRLAMENQRREQH